MELYDAAFYFFGVITLVSAWIVVSSRNIVYSAFALLFTFFGVTGLYVLLSADFLAVAQLLIYVGGILVLLLFGVMLTNKVVNVDIKTGTLGTLPALVIAGSTGGALYAVLFTTDWRGVHPPPPASPTTHALGRSLQTPYLLP